MGVSQGRRAGLLFALVSGEGGQPLNQIAVKFGIAEIYADCKDKASAVNDFAGRHQLDLAEICFVGDDINDVPAMKICGLAAAPAGAHETARLQADLVTTRSGGDGAVREIIDAILTGGGAADADPSRP